jgi:hypothetical protein
MFCFEGPTPYPLGRCARPFGTRYWPKQHESPLPFNPSPNTETCWGEGTNRDGTRPPLGLLRKKRPRCLASVSFSSWFLTLSSGRFSDYYCVLSDP